MTSGGGETRRGKSERRAKRVEKEGRREVRIARERGGIDGRGVEEGVRRRESGEWRREGREGRRREGNERAERKRRLE